MRFSAVVAILSVSVSVLAVSSCASLTSMRDPRPQPEMRAELNKLPGPDTGSIDKTMSQQAEQAVSAGDFRRASQMYRQLVDMYPDKEEYAIALADCLRRSGNSDAALQAIEPLVKKYPKSAAALEVQGLALMSVGEFAEATKTFDSVMSIDGKRWRTLNALGILFAIKKMNPEAIKYYNSALEVNPDSPGVLNNLGLSLAMEKQYDKAVETMMHARRHLETNSQELKHVDLDLALVYAIQGKLDEAEQISSPHLGKAALYNNMGFYAYIAKNRELAKSYLNMALTQNPMYYERAWKNLSAVNGDISSESNADDTPKGDDFAKDRAKFAEEEKAPEPAKPEKTAKAKKIAASEDEAGADDTADKKPGRKIIVPQDTPDKTAEKTADKAATDKEKSIAAVVAPVVPDKEKSAAAATAAPEKTFPPPAEAAKQDVVKQDAMSEGVKPPDALFVAPPPVQMVPPVSVSAPAPTPATTTPQ